MNDRENRPSGQPMSLAAVRHALSEERLAAYALPQDHDEMDSVARYLWNVALASALLPSLHAVEITLRNNLFNASRKVIDESQLRFSEVACWLDANPSLLYEREFKAVQDAKDSIRRTKKPVTPGRLVSNLPFGFWVSLCRNPYEHGRRGGPGLWPSALKYAFPFRPKDHQTLSAVRQRLDEIREFRNRVFHHEPIWNRDVSRYHRRLVEVIGWMNQGVAEAVRDTSPAERLYRAGPAAYRDLAGSLVRP